MLILTPVVIESESKWQMDIFLDHALVALMPFSLVILACIF